MELTTPDEGFKTRFETLYHNLYKLHPQLENNEFNLRYLRVDWFFPQHIDNVLNQIKELGKIYFKDVDLEVALCAGLLHDAGLVYKRETSSPLGHEERSVEYAQKELANLGFSKTFIEKVCECIKATEPTYISSLPEALLVRNADAYAHMISMHFFAKSNFSEDIGSFVNWFENKLGSTYAKITIPELHQELAPIVSFYRKMISNYKTYEERSYF